MTGVQILGVMSDCAILNTADSLFSLRESLSSVISRPAKHNFLKGVCNELADKTGC